MKKFEMQTGEKEKEFEEVSPVQILHDNNGKFWTER
jgi:hypothetical protein